MFLENMATAAQQVFILYIMIAVGFLADKTGLYKEKAARMTNDLLFYIVTPAIITQSFLSMELTRENATALLISAACGFAMHGVAILISLPFFRKGSMEENAIYKYAGVYGNVGYMALPMAQALLGAPGDTPMAMIMFGTYLANTDLKTMFREKKIYLAAALKLLVLPALMLLIFRLCGITGALLTACIISASAPTANNTVMFAAKYGRDTCLLYTSPSPRD